LPFDSINFDESGSRVCLLTSLWGALNNVFMEGFDECLLK